MADLCCPRLKKAPLQHDDDDTFVVHHRVHSAPQDTRVLNDSRLENIKTDTEESQLLDERIDVIPQVC